MIEGSKKYIITYPNEVNYPVIIFTMCWLLIILFKFSTIYALFLPLSITNILFFSIMAFVTLKLFWETLCSIFGKIMLINAESDLNIISNMSFLNRKKKFTKAGISNLSIEKNAKNSYWALNSFRVYSNENFLTFDYYNRKQSIKINTTNDSLTIIKNLLT